MQDINQLKNPMQNYSRIFIVVSLVVLSLALAVGHKTIGFNLQAEQIRASIVGVVAQNNSQTYKEVLVSFVVGQTEYTNIPIKNVKAPITGNYLNIFYSKSNPNIAYTSKQNISLAIFLFFLSIVLFAAAFAAHQRINKRKKEITALLQNGKKIEVQLQSIECNTGVRIWGNSPQYFVCKHPQKDIVFYSDYIWLPLKDNVDASINLYYLDENFTTYYIDTRPFYDVL